MRSKLVSALIVFALLVGSLGIFGTLSAGPAPAGPVVAPVAPSRTPETVGGVLPPPQTLPAGSPQTLNDGGLLYLTSLDIGDATFAVYNPAADAWTTMTSYETGCQMAVSSGLGELYAYGYNTGTIDLYDPPTDSWMPVMAAPPGASGNMCNLEITNAGEFLYTQWLTTTLWYTAGGVWNMLTLPFTANAMGDYDPTADQYVIGEAWTTNAHWIDVHTWAITDFSSPLANGENARASVVLNNRYYFEAAGSNWHSFDLSNPALPPLDHWVSPGWYSSAAGDRPNAVIYGASLDSMQLNRFDPATNSLTPLTGYGISAWHSSLAFVQQYSYSLPVVLRHYPFDPYFEPNDHWLDAYGPLASGQAYQAYPDDPEDYYTFTLPGARTVDVVVSDYAPTSDNGQLLVYGPAVGNERGPLVGQFGLPGQTEMRIDDLALGAGKYYVRIFTSSAYSNSQLYTLRVTY
jgi:hypothetical protein